MENEIRPHLSEDSGNLNDVPNVKTNGAATREHNAENENLSALDTTATRRDVADDARKLVYGDRHSDYGSPERNLTKIGLVWGAMLGVEPIPPRTVAVMMAGLKLVRASGRTNRDDLVDGIGYLLLADDAENHT